MTLCNIDVDLIDPSPFQSRKTFIIDDLKESIIKNGFNGAIMCRPKGKRYDLVYGERRLLAAKAVGMLVIPALVKELTDQQSEETGLVENLQRMDLDPFEEAQGLAKLKKRFKYSLADLSEKLGKARSVIAQIIARVDAPKIAVEAYYKSREKGTEYSFSLTHIDLIVRQPVEGDRVAITKWCLTNHASTRSLEQHIEHKYRKPLSLAIFTPTDDTLNRPACEGCPKKIANRREKGSKDASGDTCMDPGCFTFKYDMQYRKEAAARNCGVLPLEQVERIVGYDGGIDYSHRSEWLALADKCNADPAKRTWQQLLKDSAVEYFLLVNTRNGKYLEAAKRKQAEAYVRKAFNIKSESESTNVHQPTARDLEKRDEKKAKRFTREDVAADVATEAKGLKPIPLEHWPYLWDRFRSYDWTVAIGSALSRREINLKGDRFDALREYAATLTSREQASLYYEIVWYQESRYWFEDNKESLNDRALEIVKLFGLKVDSYYKKHLFDIRERKRVRAEAAARKQQANSKSKRASSKQAAARAN